MTDTDQDKFSAAKKFCAGYRGKAILPAKTVMPMVKWLVSKVDDLQKLGDGNSQVIKELKSKNAQLNKEINFLKADLGDSQCREKLLTEDKRLLEKLNESTNTELDDERNRYRAANDQVAELEKKIAALDAS